MTAHAEMFGISRETASYWISQRGRDGGVNVEQFISDGLNAVGLYNLGHVM